MSKMSAFPFFVNAHLCTRTTGAEAVLCLPRASTQLGIDESLPCQRAHVGQCPTDGVKGQKGARRARDGDKGPDEAREGE